MPYVMKLPEDGKTVGLPREIVQHLNKASENDVKVIIYLYSEFPDGFEDSAAAEVASALGISEQEAVFAIAYWRGAGIIESAKSIAPKEPSKPTLPKPSRIIYPAQQVAQAIESVPGMKSLVDCCQRHFGKLFNPSQLSMLYSFYDSLGFGVDILMLVAEHCAITDKKSLPYMEKVLITLSDNGITAYEDVESYLAKRLEYTTNEGKLRKLCGFSSRELTPGEKKIVSVWFNEWSVDFSLIEKAYEKTVDAIAKPSLKYMNKIISDWHENGITDVDMIGKKTADGGEKSHDVEEFFRIAVARTMGTAPDEHIERKES